MKKILLFLTIIVVFSISGCKNSKIENANSVTIKGYTIEMDADIIDKDKDGGYLKKEFKIVDKNKYTNTYVLILTNVIPEEEYGLYYYDYVRPDGTLKINGKKVDYYISSNGFKTASIYYYGDDVTLVFEVYGVSIYTENGDQIKTMPDIDESVLKSKEFKKIFKFDVKKN